jgi:predicted metal-binding membrane protein
VNGVMVRDKVKPDRARLTGGPASIAPAPGAATLALAAVSWVVAVDRMAGMDMGVATEIGSFPFFVTAWVSMMGAMMLPGAVPAVARRARSHRPALAVPPFVASYLAVWTLVGLAVYALYRPHGTATVWELSSCSSPRRLPCSRNRCERKYPLVPVPRSRDRKEKR